MKAKILSMLTYEMINETETNVYGQCWMSFLFPGEVEDTSLIQLVQDQMTVTPNVRKNLDLESINFTTNHFYNKNKFTFDYLCLIDDNNLQSVVKKCEYANYLTFERSANICGYKWKTYKN